MAAFGWAGFDLAGLDLGWAVLGEAVLGWSVLASSALLRAGPRWLGLALGQSSWDARLLSSSCPTLGGGARLKPVFESTNADLI